MTVNAGTALLIKDVGFVPVIIGLVVVLDGMLAYRLGQKRNRP